MNYSKKHIVHVSEVLATGIVEFIKILATDISDYQHSVIYRVRELGYTDESIKKEFPTNVQFIKWTTIDRPINLRKDIQAGYELYQLLQPLRPDIIHLHSSKAGFIGRIVAPLLINRNAIIYTPNGAPFARTDISGFKRKLFQFCEKIADACSGNVICVSRSEAELYESIGISTKYVNNGTPVNQEQARLKSSSKFRIVTSGRITKQKNPIKFNKIATHFATNPDIEFIWIGDGDMRKQLKSPNITVSGWIKQEAVSQHLKSADIYISTSSWEGLPFSVLEAMSIGLPILLSNCIGNKDLVNHDYNGFLYDTEQEAIKYIEALVKQPDKVQQLGRHSMQFCQENFSKEKMTDEYLKIYDSLVLCKEISPRLYETEYK